MTPKVREKLTAMLEARGLALEAFTDDPDELTNEEARFLMKMLPGMFREIQPQKATSEESGDVA
jgi:hypothetical protein